MVPVVVLVSGLGTAHLIWRDSRLLDSNRNCGILNEVWVESRVIAEGMSHLWWHNCSHDALQGVNTG